MQNLFNRIFGIPSARKPLPSEELRATGTHLHWDTPAHKSDGKIGYNKALIEAYESMNKEFYATYFIREVRRLSGTKAFDATILRDLRQMRSDHPEKYLWRCIDNQHAKYQKFEETKLN